MAYNLTFAERFWADFDICFAAIDDHFHERAYSVAGLGDAGDRQFGRGSIHGC